MKQISCKELGSTTCPFIATDETEDGLTKKVLDHAGQHHKDLVANMTESDKQKMLQTIKAKFSEQK